MVKAILSRKRGLKNVEAFGMQVQGDQVEAAILQASVKYAIDIRKVWEEACENGTPLILILRDIERAKAAVGLFSEGDKQRTEDMILRPVLVLDRTHLVAMLAFPTGTF